MPSDRRFSWRFLQDDWVTAAATSAPHGPGWMLDEVAGAGRENLDAEHVARYDDKETLTP